MVSPLASRTNRPHDRQPQLRYHDPALSFASQPSFRVLAEAVAKEPGTDIPFTLICGAGVSIDAGLPSWPVLVERLCESIRPETLINIIKKDPTDFPRKVSFIKQLLDPARDLDEVVRDALYRTFDEESPSILGDAIARLVSSLGRRASVITTNFDDRLEVALTNYFAPHSVESFGIAEQEEWRDRESRDGVAVMHIHGMVSRTRPPIKPITLSEIDFIENGPQARAVVAEALRVGHVIFIGVSMADPNLIGPLIGASPPSASSSGSTAKLRPEGHHVFLLAVPDVVPEASLPQCFEYARVRCEHLRDALSLETVLLKSYSQVSQLLYELSLALREPREYLRPGSTTRYGRRLVRVLNSVYSSFGMTAARDSPNGAQLSTLSDRLHRELVKPAGPARLLSEWRRRLPADYLDELGLDEHFMAGEHFGLFLWLRLRSRRRHGQEVAQYAIRMIGSSAYAHREDWSFRQVLPIAPGSSYVAADVAFYGNRRAKNFPEATRHRVWGSALAIPIVWSERDDGLDVLTVGSVTLNSTHEIHKEADIRGASGDVRKSLKPSIISFLTGTQKAQLMEALHGAAIAALTDD